MYINREADGQKIIRKGSSTMMDVNGSPQIGDNKKIDFKGILPLYFQLKEIIKDDIRNKKWKVGELIPSENKLSEAYGVSVGTVKKTLSELAAEGLVYRRKGKGTYITRPDFIGSFTRFFLHGLRDENEKVQMESEVLESAVIRPDHRVKETLRLKNKSRVICIKRVRLMNNMPYMLETIYLPNEIFKGFESIDISRGLLYPIYERQFNTPVIWAEEFLEPKVADKSKAKFLDLKVGSPLIAVERTAYTFNDIPIEMRLSFGRGDCFRYRLEIR